MRRDDLIRMRHMLDAAQKAIAFAAGKSRIDVTQDPMLAFALVRAVEVIGEAASKISRDSQERHKEIPWRQIIGIRHRLIHGYDSINFDILWETVTVALPPFVDMLERIIGSESEE
jgi:uncharacterized protein with HEPN domain